MRAASVVVLALVLAALTPQAAAQGGHMPVLGSGFAPYGNYTANFTSEGLWIKTGPPKEFPLTWRIHLNASNESATGLGNPRIAVEWFPSDGSEMQRWVLNATELPNGTYTAAFTFPAAGHFHVSFRADPPDLRFVGPGMINIDDPPAPAKSPVPAWGAFLAVAAIAAAAIAARRG
ncbi:MAG TPA: hypothetical protein VM889_14080 [Candidatus Thermoplasmatota archaeon]|nr:hypothetical protein [Candidatus Thermoplasmatota archaeon]